MLPFTKGAAGCVELTTNRVRCSVTSRSRIACRSCAVATFVVEDNGFGFQKVPVVSVINSGAIGATQATGTAVVGGVNDTSILQPRVQ